MNRYNILPWGAFTFYVILVLDYILYYMHILYLLLLLLLFIYLLLLYYSSRLQCYSIIHYSINTQYTVHKVLFSLFDESRSRAQGYSPINASGIPAFHSIPGIPAFQHSISMEFINIIYDYIM